MFFSDVLANTLSIMRTGYIGKFSHVTVPVTKKSIEVLDHLAAAGAIRRYELLRSDKVQKYAKVYLNFVKGRQAVSEIKLVSKISNRCYFTYDAIRAMVHDRPGYLIVSTSKGIMSGVQCCEQRLGGELLVWIEY